MNLKIFATVHSLIWLTTAKLTSNLFARCNTGVVIDSKPHLSGTYKTSFLFAPLAVCVLTGCFTFPFYTPTKPLMQLHIKYKTVLFP